MSLRYLRRSFLLACFICVHVGIVSGFKQATCTTGHILLVCMLKLAGLRRTDSRQFAMTSGCLNVKHAWIDSYSRALCLFLLHQYLCFLYNLLILFDRHEFRLSPTLVAFASSKFYNSVLNSRCWELELICPRSEALISIVQLALLLLLILVSHKHMGDIITMLLLLSFSLPCSRMTRLESLVSDLLHGEIGSFDYIPSVQMI